MAIKPTNTRIMITISKKQDEWLKNLSKELHITKSNTIKWLLSKNTDLLTEYIWMRNNNLTEEDIMRIVKTKWLDD